MTSQEFLSRKFNHATLIGELEPLLKKHLKKFNVNYIDGKVTTLTDDFIEVLAYTQEYDSEIYDNFYSLWTLEYSLQNVKERVNNNALSDSLRIKLISETTIRYELLKKGLNEIDIQTTCFRKFLLQHTYEQNVSND